MGGSPKTSPFLNPGSTSSPSSLAVLHLRRDQLLPTFLRDDESTNSGYAEGHVTNTRFGSYPHSTLIGIPWGTQVVASQVDTGSRGRKNGTQGPKKRKAAALAVDDRQQKKAKLSDEDENEIDNERPQSIDEAQRDSETVVADPRSSILKQPSAASSGFCHIIPPTPESWTVSLPHRTQVVYTPDYSYIIQKLRLRPGSVVIEAGAGSGSFTHAAARAAFNGYPPLPESPSEIKQEAQDTCKSPQESQKTKHGRFGRLYSYEYHASRAEQLRGEISSHGLEALITISHRDVYTSGFLVPDLKVDEQSAQGSPTSPNASHIFLDLPSPWHALPHLTRKQPSALDPTKPIYICMFLPCIEQAQRAVAALRAHSWVEINMQQLSHRRLDVRREKVGLDFQGYKGVNASPASVDEACRRLREVEMHGRRFQNRSTAKKQYPPLASASDSESCADSAADAAKEAQGGHNGKQAPRHETNMAKKAPGANRVDGIAGSQGVPPFRQGRLVHRTEPEIRTHTSYLVFAVLPRATE